MPAEAQPRDESGPFFAACAKGTLLVQGCATCGHRQFYPRRHCLQCDGTDLDWVEVSGEGELVTYSVVRRAPSTQHKERVPYVVGVVKLVEGPQMMASIIGAEIESLICGMSVRIVPTVVAGPCFAPVGTAAA